MMMLISRAFKGGVVLVSHDQNLLQSVCHQVALSTEILIVVIHDNNLKYLKCVNNTFTTGQRPEDRVTAKNIF